MKYLSHQIQDEIIDILSQRVKADIISEINEASFYSIFIDITQDVSKIDQLSQVYRYATVIKNDMDIATDIQINEVFWASELENQILGSIEKNGTDLSKCRGQGYDGATNMSGAYSGVQARIAEREPLARYVDCAAHNLNLALNDTVKSVPGVKQFYDPFSSMYNFFGHSVKRWALLAPPVEDEGRGAKVSCLYPAEEARQLLGLLPPVFVVVVQESGAADAPQSLHHPPFILLTIATSERSFSKKKLMNNHLRSTVGQERLSGLAMLSIAHERAKKMDIQSIVDEFVERKARRMPFK
nr:PREDICTED: zinc finger MYM-type protein 1-like [Stegastes partitus]